MHRIKKSSAELSLSFSLSFFLFLLALFSTVAANVLKIVQFYAFVVLSSFLSASYVRRQSQHEWWATSVRSICHTQKTKIKYRTMRTMGDESHQHFIPTTLGKAVCDAIRLAVCVMCVFARVCVCFDLHTIWEFDWDMNALLVFLFSSSPSNCALFRFGYIFSLPSFHPSRSIGRLCSHRYSCSKTRWRTPLTRPHCICVTVKSDSVCWGPKL